MMSIMPLTLTDVVSSCKQNIVSDMGGEKVMLNIKNGNYYNLGQIGGRIWDCIHDPVSVGALVDRLTEEFDVDDSACAEQVFSFLEQLRGEGLLLVNEENKNAANV
jgi:hypothetical protein